MQVHLIGHDWGAVLAYLLGAKVSSHTRTTHVISFFSPPVPQTLRWRPWTRVFPEKRGADAGGGRGGDVAASGSVPVDHHPGRAA